MDQSRDAVLDAAFRPAGRFDLVRLGKKFDGGYLADRRDVLASTVLLSLGINDDWSFETQFLALNKVPLHAYDGTISRSGYVKKIAKTLAKGKSPRQPLSALLGYKDFFSGTNVHYDLSVGLSHQPGFTSLRSIFETHTKPSDRVFVKVDIEGWEYRVLPELAQFANRMSSLVIEFHDFDLHREVVTEFLKSVDLQVCHVHCNNYGLLADDGTPLAIELTLSSHDPVTEQKQNLPDELDQPNNPELSDYPIVFRDE